MMLGNPRTPAGAITWIGLGLGAAVIALFVGMAFPSIIPASAASVKL